MKNTKENIRNYLVEEVERLKTLLAYEATREVVDKEMVGYYKGQIQLANFVIRIAEDEKMFNAVIQTYKELFK